MEALRIELYQDSACYRKPFAYKVTETYPLPPYSTVIGMLHNILGAEEYVPMEVSIQGDYESIFNSYNTMYFYKSNAVTTMPLNIHMLYGINLIIHVTAAEEVLKQLYKKIKSASEYFSLGRREDLARIDKVEFVQVYEQDAYEYSSDGNYTIKRPIYIPKKQINCELNGINYRLNTRYQIKNDIRVWEKVDVLYVDAGEEIDDGLIFIDKKYDDLVCFS